jgi:eukaryotic-like serine/threonine-protein kinase
VPGAERPPEGREEVLAEGTVVAGYAVVQLAAEGGFALLYRARDPSDGSVCALKVLRRALTFVGNGVPRFHREIQALHELEHPHVVRVLTHGDLADGRPYLVMEWLGGRDLERHLAETGALGLADVLAIAEPLGAALDAAHALGIVHRDVTARNVMMAPRGDALVPTLIDFGVAHWASRERGAGFSSQTMVGSPSSMAPEQILGHEVDARTDVYAFGILLFQMATGSMPFASVDAVELEEMHLVGVPPLPSHRAPLPAAFDRLVTRCLAKRPEERPPSVGAVVDELRALLQEQARGEVCGVHVELRVGGDDPTDDELDRVDAALSLARSRLDGRAVTVDEVHASALLARCASAAAARDAGRAVYGALVEALAGTAVAAIVTIGAARDDAALSRTGTWVAQEPGLWTGAADATGRPLLARVT